MIFKAGQDNLEDATQKPATVSQKAHIQLFRACSIFS
jgi:hypothetical protein